MIRLGLDLDSAARVCARRADEPSAPSSVFPPERLLVGWLGRMTEIKQRRRSACARSPLLAPADVDADLAARRRRAARGRASRRWPRELGVRDRCHFTGFRSDVGAIYAASDVVALTSANEGTPVTRDRGAGRRQAGRLDRRRRRARHRRRTACPASSSGPATSTPSPAELRLLADDPELRARLGDAGRGAGERYSVPRLVHDVDTLYRDAARARRPRGARSSHAPRRLCRARCRRRGCDRASRPLRIVLVSQYFPPEIGATQTRMQAFAEYLAGRGHDVTVVAEFPNHPQGVIPPEYRGRIVEDDRSNPYRVLRVWVRTSPEKTQMTRLSFYLSYMALAVAVAPFTGPCDVVVATTPPLFAGGAGWAIARLKRAPLVLDVRDLWPAAATSLNQISTGRLGAARGGARARALPACRGGRRGDAAVLRAHRSDPRRSRAATALDSERHARAVLRRGRRARPARRSRRQVPRHVRRHARDRAGASVRARRGGARERDGALRVRRRRSDEAASDRAGA